MVIGIMARTVTKIITASRGGILLGVVLLHQSEMTGDMTAGMTAGNPVMLPQEDTDMMAGSQVMVLREDMPAGNRVMVLRADTDTAEGNPSTLLQEDTIARITADNQILRPGEPHYRLTPHGSSVSPAASSRGR